ncbi:MAG: glutaminyl-peptide cyclotransferase [Gammaproteobacteria bacterium]|nr:glutaminyl-peptide cyclotransferase [Gammaproteobacteria bacterium]
MKIASSLLITLLFLLSPTAWAQLPTYGYEVVNRYPHDPLSFTQGLLYHQGFLYEGTGRNGQSLVKKSTLEDGDTIISKHLSNRYFGEGIQIVGDKIYQLTWQSHMVFVYDKETFEQVGNFYNPTEGWGLAYDGSELILSDGSDKLYFLDPETFVSSRKIDVTIDGKAVSQLNELEFINGEIWANIWHTDYIVRIDPSNGEVNSLVDLTGLSEQTARSDSEAVLNGIAYDEVGGRLFVTGKLWSDIFEIELIDPP